MNDRLPSLIVVSGPSGAGKSTILTRVLEEMRDLRFSVSHTTRASREAETEGVQYYFVDRPTFEDMQARDLFLESAEVHGQLYGTSRKEHERAGEDGVDLLLDLDVQGAAQVRRAFVDAVSVFILPPSVDRRDVGLGPVAGADTHPGRDAPHGDGIRPRASDVRPRQGPTRFEQRTP